MRAYFDNAMFFAHHAGSKQARLPSAAVSHGCRLNKFDELTILKIDEKYPGSSWAVLRATTAPEDLPVCSITYFSAEFAGSVLDMLGFKASGHAMDIPALPGSYDETTMMRFSAGRGLDVVLIRIC